MPAVTCPSPADLAKLYLGDLAQTDADALEHHVVSCAACMANLKKLLLTKDTLAGILSGQDTGHDLAEHPAVQALMEKLEGLRPGEISTQAFESAPAAPPPSMPTEGSETPDEEENLPLEQIGPYRLGKKLGAGGMGLVYEAIDINLERPVALKVMKPSLAKSAAARKRFLQEARSAAAIQHDHIVPIFQVGEDQGIPYLAMQLLEGESLAELLKRHKSLPADQVIRLGLQIARGLSAAHLKGLIHRDIKPANIWLERTFTAEDAENAERGSSPRESHEDNSSALSAFSAVSAFRVKILDFGLARQEKGHANLTKSGAILGTPAFMAPEQARGEAVDARADLFSLGCVFYTMATGQTPFKGDNTMAILSSLANDTPPPPRTVNGEVPAALSELNQRLLEKDATKRPTSAQEVFAVLSKIDYRPVDEASCFVATPTGDATTRLAHAPTTKQDASSTKPRRWLPIAAALIIGFIPLAYFFGGTIIRFATNQGELRIEIADEKVEVKIVQNGLTIVDPTSKREFTLTAGKGQIEVHEKDGIKLTTKKFELTRGGKTTVTVTWQELAEVRKKGEPGASTTGDPDRRAAEWVLSIGGGIGIRENGKGIQVATVKDLPGGPFDLTQVSFAGSPKVTDAGLENFKYCKNLTHLSLYHMTMSEAALANFKNCKNLTYLTLSHMNLPETGLSIFKDCKNLVHLSLDHMTVPDAALAYFKDCKKIELLNLTATHVSDVGIAHLNDLKKLTHLLIPWTNVTDAGLAHFKDCKNLSGLAVMYTQVTEAGLAHFKDLKNLTGLDLGGARITDAALAVFSECKNISNFSVVESEVTDAGLKLLGDLKGLSNLNLDANRKVTDASLLRLRNCPNLTTLRVAGTPITDAGLAHLKNHKELYRLVLSGSQVSDAGLDHLKELKSLIELDLDYTQVSDAGLPVLAGLRLSRLNLPFSRFSRQGYEQLKAAMPNCQINWSETNRTAAEQVLALGGMVEIAAPGKKDARPVKSADALPKEFFQVRRISLKGVTKLPGEGLEPLWQLKFAEFDRLEAIDLSGTNPHNLRYVTVIHGLETVDLSGRDLPEFEFLTQIPRLKHLGLAGVGLTDDRLANCPKLSKLERLVLDDNPILGRTLGHLQTQPEFIDLSLNCPSIADLLAKNLAELKRLKRLSLVGANLSDAGIRHLKGLTNLTTLDLRKTKATAAGIERLRQALPKCRIEWDGGVIEAGKK